MVSHGERYCIVSVVQMELLLAVARLDCFDVMAIGQSVSTLTASVTLQETKLLTSSILQGIALTMTRVLANFQGWLSGKTCLIALFCCLGFIFIYIINKHNKTLGQTLVIASGTKHINSTVNNARIVHLPLVCCCAVLI